MRLHSWTNRATDCLAVAGSGKRLYAAQHCEHKLSLCIYVPVLSRMGKVPVRLKEVVYTVSPFEVTVMSGLFKDMPKKFAEKVKHVSLTALL